MAARTTSQAGNWSASSTWGGSAAPGIGDTASIGHAVTVDVDTTVGTSGISGTSDVTLTAAVDLTIAAGVSFHVRSDLTLVAGTGSTPNGLVMGAGSKYYFDGSVSNVSYKIKMGTGSTQCVRITATGTSGNRFRFESLGTAAGAFTQSGATTGQLDLIYGTFVNVASSTFNGNKTNATMNIRYCDFDSACGAITIGTMSSTCSNLIEHNKFQRSGTGISISQGYTSGQTCTYKGNVHTQGNVSFLNLTNGPTYIEDNIWGGTVGIVLAGSLAATTTIVRNNMFWRSSGVDCAAWGDFTGNYYGFQSGAGSNPHGPTVTAQNARTVNFTGNIFEFTGAATNGDMICGGAPSVAVTLNVANNLNLAGGGGSSGTLVSFLGGANLTLKFDHNTCFVSASTTGNLVVRETYATHAGMVASMRDNLMYNTASTAAELTHQFTSQCADDCYTVYGYNARWNLTGAEYNLTSPSSRPITTDNANTQSLSGNPFVDSTRNIAAWSTSLGGAGTGADAFTELCKSYDEAGYNTAYTPAALYTYITNGFKVTTAALNNAGHDGATIGAMGYVALTALYRPILGMRAV